MIRSGTTFINIKMEVGGGIVLVNLHFEVTFVRKLQRKRLPRKGIKEREVVVEATRETQVVAVCVSLNGMVFMSGLRSRH
jgi:hypothetical protein